MVVKRIQNHRNAVVVRELVVAPKLGRENAVGLGVQAANSKKNAFFRVEDSDFGLLGGGVAFADQIAEEDFIHVDNLARRMVLTDHAYNAQHL